MILHTLEVPASISGRAKVKVIRQEIGRSSYGRRSVVWNSKDEKGMAVSSGIYLYQVEFLGKDRKFRSTRKMVLLK